MLTNNINSIDDEWSLFLNGTTSSSYAGNILNLQKQEYIISDEDDEEEYDNDIPPETKNNSNNLLENELLEIPEPTPIYISTKSKIAYLTDPIDLRVFWEIPIVPYYIPKDGVIKKQMKFNSKTKEELNDILHRLNGINYYEETIMSHIDNPNGRIKFKDIRKISIGLSKKDILSYRSKKKQAFYNCFVLILRLNLNNEFKEFHIKIFNTGQLEIPGIQSDEMYEYVLQYLIDLLQPYHEKKLEYKQNSDTVLINSNFNCGFYVNREVLYDLLKFKYNLQTIYDPCSYPGIQSKFYYNCNTDVQDGRQVPKEEQGKHILEVSFMIFRTGSVLIVGKCETKVLYEIYEFLKTILKNEFIKICQRLITIDDKQIKNKNKKIRKKIISNIVEDTQYTPIKNKEFANVNNGAKDKITNSSKEKKVKLPNEKTSKKKILILDE